MWVLGFGRISLQGISWPAKWHGPYLILRKLGELNYEIQKEQGGWKVMAHKDQLKKFQVEEAPKHELSGVN